MTAGHTCDFLVVVCMDFRLQEHIYTHFHGIEDHDKYDRLEIAGAAKDLDYLMKEVDLSVRLHNIKKVFLVGHEDCGAYDGGGLEVQKPDLDRAMEEIAKKYPEVEVEKWFLGLDGGWEKLG